MTREKMMGSEDYKEFGEKCGIPIKVAKFSDGDGTFSWAVPTDTNTNTQNTTTLSFVDSSNDIIIRNTTGGAGSGTSQVR